MTRLWMTEPHKKNIIKALRARLEYPLRNIGGNEVNIVSQATVTVSCGEYKSQINPIRKVL